MLEDNGLQVLISQIRNICLQGVLKWDINATTFSLIHSLLIVDCLCSLYQTLHIHVCATFCTDCISSSLVPSFYQKLGEAWERGYISSLHSEVSGSRRERCSIYIPFQHTLQANVSDFIVNLQKRSATTFQQRLRGWHLSINTTIDTTKLRVASFPGLPSFPPPPRLQFKRG